MIQKIRIANAKPRLNRSGPFVARAIYQPLHSRLYQSARAHHAGFDGRINNRVGQSVVTNFLAAPRAAPRFPRGLSGRCRCGFCFPQPPASFPPATMQVPTGTSPRCALHRAATSAWRIQCASVSLSSAAVMIETICKRRQTTENLTIGVALKHCQASGYSEYRCSFLGDP